MFTRIEMIIKNLEPLSANKTFIGKKLGYTMVSAITTSSVIIIKS